MVPLVLIAAARRNYTWLCSASERLSQFSREARLHGVCAYYCNTYYKAAHVWRGEGGGHLLRETTSRGGLVCPSSTSERGGEGYCVKEGRGEEGKREGERERERAMKVRLRYSLGY